MRAERKITHELRCDPVHRPVAASRTMAAGPDPLLRLQRQLGNGLVAALAGAPAPSATGLPGRPGRPLAPVTRTTMESRFGHDFGGVRVHDDPAAARSADELDAVAYTVDRNVVLGADGYAPGTAAGRRLLAHELAHVVQQDTRSAASGRPSPSSPGAAEREAHTAAEAAGLERPIHIRERLAPGAVARQPKEPSGRFPPAVEAMPREQILEIWRRSKDVADFKLRLLGPVPDERLLEFLGRKGMLSPRTPAQAEPAYTGPSIGPTPEGQQIVGRIIHFTHPEGGTITRYVRGTPDELDRLQDEENLRAAVQMAWGLATGLAGVSAARGAGAPPSAAEPPRAAERRPAPPPPPVPTIPPRPPARPAPPLPVTPPAPTAPPAPAVRPAPTTAPPAVPPTPAAGRAPAPHEQIPPGQTGRPAEAPLSGSSASPGGPVGPRPASGPGGFLLADPERAAIGKHVKEGRKLTPDLKDRLREDARAQWRIATKGIGPQPGEDWQVHHVIPLEFSHLFPEMNPNNPANLVLMKRHAHNQWHAMINEHVRRNGVTVEQLKSLQVTTIKYNEGDVIIMPRR
ncbi:eCIS core domain-containing protein [Thermomonospora amylolytica]|uniref:eCIS core domain-containing protein n=1 Tax=Thermomonospora amylolytica TaxID=1411117 RepID=UPI0018E53627|nr:DUF4157 domain-containing protein [Thermomonospora amylolytica]